MILFGTRISSHRWLGHFGSPIIHFLRDCVAPLADCMLCSASFMCNASKLDQANMTLLKFSTKILTLNIKQIKDAELFSLQHHNTHLSS